MYALSVLLKKGHSIRVAIAGHDGANFQRFPENTENVTLRIQRNRTLSSYIDLPLQVREAD